MAGEPISFDDVRIGSFARLDDWVNSANLRQQAHLKKARRPRYIPAITVITLVYLCFELAFNAKLLDVTGALSNTADVNNVEHWGRLLSGFAVAIALWGWVVFPLSEKRSWGATKTILMLGLVAAPCIYTAYHGEDRLVTSIVDGSGGAQRKAALMLQTMTAMVERDQIDVSGLDLSRNMRLTPQGKAFLTILPIQALSVQDLDGRLMSALEAQIRGSVISEAGDPNTAYHAYIEAERGIVRMYDRGYVPAVNQYHDTLNRRPSSYQRAQAQRLFTDAVQRTTGLYTQDDDLSIQAFFESASIQQRLRRKLGLGEQEDVAFGMNAAEFKTRTWDRKLGGEVQQRINSLHLAPSAFEDGGIHAEDGRDAMEGAVAAPIALVFSILGTLFHTFKVSRYILIWARPGWPAGFRDVGLGVGVTALFAAPFLVKNAITASAVFRGLNHNVAASYAAPFGDLFADGLQWIVQAEAIAFPLFQAIHRCIPL